MKPVTKTIGGIEITLPPGRYFAARPLADREMTEFPIRIYECDRSTDIVKTLPPMAYDAANDFLVAFNQEKGIKGRPWYSDAAEGTPLWLTERRIIPSRMKIGGYRCWVHEPSGQRVVVDEHNNSEAVTAALIALGKRVEAGDLDPASPLSTDEKTVLMMVAEHFRETAPRSSAFMEILARAVAKLRNS